MRGRFLGIDASTQSLTAVLVDLDLREVVHQTSLGFDAALPEYRTRNGVLPHDDPRIAHAPPLLWVEALDRLCERLARSVELAAIRAVALSAQQHGSVYLSTDGLGRLGRMEASRGLAESLAGAFSRLTSPIWQDSSTALECEEIRAALGGRRATAQLTGSDTFERFTGPQIRRFYKTDPAGYERTAHVALVSSFLTSVLAGRPAPIDHGDGAGMNLMDLERRQWSEPALAATAPDLRSRLPPLCAPWEPVGSISSTFVGRYGFAPDTLILPGSGDNPCSLVGVGLIEPGLVAVSLGTSDTLFGVLPELCTDPEGLGHVFVAPTGDPMTLICFRNGSLARERIRDRYHLDWPRFSQALRETEPGNDGRFLLPYFEPEIVPRVGKPGVRRFGGLEEEDAAANCRAVVEAQMLAMRLHSAWMGARPKAIHSTGGGSENREILEVMAAVHGCPVHRLEVTSSAALGAALRAAHGYLESRGAGVDWAEIVAGFTDPVPGSTVEPDPAAIEVYDRAVGIYAELEATVVQESGNVVSGA